MPKCLIEITDDQYQDLLPLLNRSNRTYRNYCHSLVLAAIKASKSGSGLLDIENDLGKVNPKKKNV